jgi:DNA-binding protein H-NS
VPKDINLDDLDLDELKVLARNIEKAIKSRAALNLKKAREAAEAAAKQFGYSLEEVVGAKPPSSDRRGSDAKYRNPEDPTKVWSGRGRQPQWFKHALAMGRTLEDLTT